MSERRVDFGVCEGTMPLVVRDVPASVCEQCGERSFSDAVVDVLERIRDGGGPQPRLGYLYAYDYNEAARRPERTTVPSTSVPSLYFKANGTVTASLPLLTEILSSRL